MATRMRQRRGTATQWTNSNPVLGAGEIGWESDTNKFKIGDGINHWADLDYFVDESSISTSLGDYVETSTLGQNDGVATLDSSGKLESSQVPTNLATTTALDLKQDKVSGVSDTEIGYLDGVTSAIQTQIDSKAPTSNPTFTGTVTTEDLVINGDVTVNSGEFLASATSILIEDNLIQIAHENAANTVDLGLVVGYTESSTAKHAGIVRDVSSDKWKLFKGVTTEPSTTVDFTQGTLDDLEVAGLVASSATIGDVSNTELQYLNGVTSSIQTQIDAKLDSTTASSTYLTQSSASSVYAPLASPTFTGTVSGITKSMVGLGNVDNTSDANKPVSTATQTALNLKANLASPTFTGTVVLPNNTVTNDMLAGSIANNKLANSSITINGSAVSLGGSTTISATPTMNEQVFTANGTFTVPAGVTKIQVEVQGGGGGGGGGDNSSPAFGGSQGMFFNRTLSVTAGQNLSVVVGGGGSGGIAGGNGGQTSGSAGVASSISTVSSPGGSGGRWVPISTSTVGIWAGSNGAGPGGGRGGFYISYFPNTSESATAGTANSGSGGGGGAPGGTKAGGAGGSGYVIVRWLS